MSFNLRSYTRNILCFMAMLLLFSLPTLAQSVKPKPAKQGTKTITKAEEVQTLTRDNLQKEAYKMWLYWYRAQQQGKSYPPPTLDIPNSLDPKEAQHVRSVWKQAQQQAQRDFQQSQGQMIKKMDMQTAYKIWADWYSAQQQGRRIAMPNLIVSNVGEKEAQRVTAIWEKARIKAQNDIQAQAANNNPQQPTQLNNKTQNIQTVALPQANNGVHLSSAVAAGTPNTRLFAGQEYDPDLGFYYLRARSLNTATGRFLTQDIYEGDIEQPASLHKYMYAQNNPVNKFDPTGKFAVNIAIGNNFRTAFATSPTFGNVTNTTKLIFNQDDPFPPLKGEHLLLTTEALFQSLVVTTSRSDCDKALINIEGHAGTRLSADIATIVNERKIFDGTLSTAYSNLDKKPVRTVLDDFRSSVTFAMTPNRESDLREKFTPPVIFLGQYFFTNLNRTEKTDLEFRSIVLLHESVHYFGYRGHKKYGETRGLNKLIRDACFPGYKSAALQIAQ